MNYLFVVFLWIAYCALHSFLVSTGVTNLLISKLKKYFAFYRLFYVIISFVLLVPLIKYTSNLDDDVIINYSYPYSVIRYALIAGSLIIFFWAFFFNYDSLSFFGIRQILNLSKAEKLNSDEGLKKNGLLGLTRHPMYLALIIYLWCQTFRVTDIIVNTLLTIYVIIGTMLEEKKLVLEFGETYIRYKQEVPMLIPFLKFKG